MHLIVNGVPEVTVCPWTITGLLCIVLSYLAVRTCFPDLAMHVFLDKRHTLSS